MPFFKRPLRLPSSEYRGRRTYFVTLGTENRAKFFEDLSTGRWLLARLIEVAPGFNFSLHAYCVMPDHLHFISEGLSDTCDLVKFVDAFKQRTAFEFGQLRRERLWQRRYYDHILRPHEAVEDVACYVWWNPVRKGLCAEPFSYPLSGSQTIEWMKSSSAQTKWKPSWK